MHFSFLPLKDGKAVTTLKAGDVYREQFRVLGYPRAEASSRQGARGYNCLGLVDTAQRLYSNSLLMYAPLAKLCAEGTPRAVIRSWNNSLVKNKI